MRKAAEAEAEVVAPTEGAEEALRPAEEERSSHDHSVRPRSPRSEHSNRLRGRQNCCSIAPTGRGNQQHFLAAGW